jgi:hypothetical protein
MIRLHGERSSPKFFNALWILPDEMIDRTTRAECGKNAVHVASWVTSREIQNNTGLHNQDTGTAVLGRAAQHRNGQSQIYRTKFPTKHDPLESDFVSYLIKRDRNGSSRIHFSVTLPFFLVRMDGSHSYFSEALDNLMKERPIVLEIQRVLGNSIAYGRESSNSIS